MSVTSMRSAVFVLPLLALYSASLRGPAGAVAAPSAGFVADFGCAGARGTADVKELFLLNGEVVNRDRFESVPRVWAPLHRHPSHRASESNSVEVR